MTSFRSLASIGAALCFFSSIAHAEETAPAPSGGPAAPPSQVAPSAPAEAPAAPSGNAAPEASASPPSDAIYVAQPPLPPLEPRSRHYHDGFYLRLSVGFGGRAYQRCCG